MDNVSRGQKAAARDNRVAGGQAVGEDRIAQQLTLLADLRPAFSVYRTVNAAAAEQCPIGGVHDRVGVFGGKIADLYDYAAFEKLCKHFTVL
jgi:hypothetical protein